MPQKTPLPLLPMNLAMTLLTTLSWPIALQCANAGLLPLKKDMVRKDLVEKLPQKKLSAAIHAETKQRISELLLAILRFNNSSYKRDVKEPPCIWQLGNARLLDYSVQQNYNHSNNDDHDNDNYYDHYHDCDNSAPLILFVPSLINRYYILDLEKERSMLRFLATQSIDTMVLDWREPGKMEEDFSVADYVTEILLPAIDFLHKTSGKKIILAGYCMGGVLAAAAAQLCPKKIEKLALFATPWNFHCREFSSFILDKKYQQSVSSLILKQQSLPAEIIQSLFYFTDPFLFEEKFRRFIEMDCESRAAKDFIALEHWVNDGVAMTANVAHDCLIDWTQQNILSLGKWQIGKVKINPQKIKQPTFIAIPKNDHIVPYDCAIALAEEIKNSYVINPSSGHVGMIVGSRARSECWNPLVEWIKK